MARPRTDLGIDDAEIERTADAVRTALAGGGRADRATFVQILSEAGIRVDGQRTYHLIGALAVRQVVCWGPPSDTRDHQQSLVLVDEWIGGHSDRTPLERDEALAELACRYLIARGPATDRDLAFWAGLPLTDARRAYDVAGDRIDTLDVAGTPHHAIAEPVPAHHGALGVRALPGFDEWIIGYRDRTPVLHEDQRGHVRVSANGTVRPVIVEEGRVIGTWSWNRGAPQIELFAGTPAAEAAAREAIEDYAAFLRS